jgi:hypothetical protein
MSAGEDAVETVTDLLRNLGDTADAVADTLHMAGVTGVTDNVFADPVANYLKLRGIQSPEVDLECVALDAYENPDMTDGPFRVHHPRPVRDFLVAFDNGEYADLLAEQVA